MNEGGWPDQNEAARQLGVRRKALWRGRTTGRIPERYYSIERRRGRGAVTDCYYDVDAIRADPNLRCRHEAHAGGPDTPFAFNKSGLCKAHSGGSVKGSEGAARAGAAVAAFQRHRHEQARERFRTADELTSREIAGLMHVASPASVTDTYVPAGLQVARVERIAAVTYQVYRASDFKRWRRGWVTGGDRRRRRWEEAEKVLSVLGGRGLIELEAERRGLTVAETRILVARRVEERHRELARHRRGNTKKSFVTKWAEALADAMTYWSDRDRLGLLEEIEPGVLEKVPGPLEICRAIAEDDYSLHPDRWKYSPTEHPGNAARRVLMAIRQRAARQ